MTNEQATAKKSERAKNESAIVTANHAVVSHESGGQSSAEKAKKGN
jgi:hypothetical protein